jgi:hypothetical protein
MKDALFSKSVKKGRVLAAFSPLAHRHNNFVMVSPQHWVVRVSIWVVGKDA